MREDEADSLVRLGKDYLHIRNYDKAMEYLGHAVMLGKTNAAQDLYALGEHFLAEKNYKKAEEAFQMLADRGHGESCLILGEMCEKGLGRQRDYQAAFGFYSESFQQGVDRGAYRAGMLMREDALRVAEVRDIALTWLEEAIKAGIYEAYAVVGDLYSEHFTAGSTPRDDQEAFSWYMKGAMRCASFAWRYASPRAMGRSRISRVRFASIGRRRMPGVRSPAGSLGRCMRLVFTCIVRSEGRLRGFFAPMSWGIRKRKERLR